MIAATAPETQNGRQETAAASSRPSKQYQRVWRLLAIEVPIEVRRGFMPMLAALRNVPSAHPYQIDHMHHPVAGVSR